MFSLMAHFMLLFEVSCFVLIIVFKGKKEMSAMSLYKEFRATLFRIAMGTEKYGYQNSYNTKQ